MEKKLIVPAEVKVCATCSYWDGERRVDDEFSLVVVAEERQGECLINEKHFVALQDIRCVKGCAWEPIAADDDSMPEALRKVG